ncbi:MAG: hypothetical protein K2J87_04645, partial [Muribaculaceae bacterium]|nr:hypothetical protein [Muribaculaceae bacterium]
TECLKTMAQNEYVMLVFKTFNKELEDGKTKEMAGLYKAVSGPDADFVLQKEYSRDILSTDPIRMKEVFEDALKETGKIFNLFLWGHGMAWTPYFKDHTRSGLMPENIENGPELTAFGGDNGSDWTDIDELKDAIPDDKFDTIWFDCCYMSNIETAYELRSKCKWMVAYPTEIHSDGLPYHLVLPYVLSDKVDLAGGCQALYDYYVSRGTTVTATVMNMSKIEEVAKACRAVYLSGDKRPLASGLQNYSRSYSNPYYDLGQFVREYAQANDAEKLLPKFNEALKKFVVFTVASEKDFNNRPIRPEDYSGLSTHFFKSGSSDKKELYYRELDWYKATYYQEEDQNPNEAK